MSKVLLLGITGSGKSTISELIAKSLGLEILEVDREVIRFNSGFWPKDAAVISKYMEITNENALKRDNVLYVTSWLNKKWVKQFYFNGFKIIELHADIEELLRRKVKRDNPGQDQIDTFKGSYEGYYEVVNDKEIQGLISLSLDTTRMSIEIVTEAILKVLN
ncbi:MAG: AAA family ATPase [Patescibacteria group bacterium]